MRRVPSDLSWEQALAWRLGRHHLLHRAAPPDLVRVAGDICGLHAQLMSSAELSAWARVEGLQRGALDHALWERRELVKLWAMRGTLHLLPAADLGIWLAALGTYTGRGMTGQYRNDALTDAIATALQGRVLSRAELAVTVEEITGDPSLAEVIRFSWGSYLKPASWRGRLCFAPSEDGRVRFTTPATWIPGGVSSVDRDAALREVARRFLAAYAPISAKHFGTMLGFGPARGRRMLESLGDEAVEVDVDGERVWVLAADVDVIASVESAETARLLPAFDPWTVGTSRTALLEPEQKARVYRPQGWISPVLLVNGRTAGVWSHELRGRRLRVDPEPFQPLPAWARTQLEAEAERLAAFFDRRLTLEPG